MVWCSGREGRSPAGESPAVLIARFRHVAIPRFVWVTTGSLRGVKAPAALKTLSFSGRCNQGGERVWEFEHEGMTATSKEPRHRSCMWR